MFDWLFKSESDDQGLSRVEAVFEADREAQQRIEERAPWRYNAYGSTQHSRSKV